MTADTPSSPSVPPASAQPDRAGRDGSPDRSGRAADAVNAGEEFGSGFGGYQGGNQADPQGGDAGGRAGPDDVATTPSAREQATKPPDRA